MYKFPVCPPQGRQLLDIDPADLFEDFRICSTYKSGGGYDQLPAILEKRGMLPSYKKGDPSKQFVVQLKGCHLRCPYCYVTEDGIMGDSVEYTAYELLLAFGRAYEKHNTGVFHLMGGAPGLYLDKWSHIVPHLYPNYIFHSDLLLTENYYRLPELTSIDWEHAIYAVNIKGTDPVNYRENTGKDLNSRMFMHNFELLMVSGANFYVTFTNPNMKTIDQFKEANENMFGKDIFEDSFIIDLKQYEALKDGPAW